MYVGAHRLTLARSRRSRHWYVSNDGNDASKGTKSAPFQTLARAKVAAQAQDRVLLERGSRFREELSGWPAVRISSYGAGNRPIIDARDVVDNDEFNATGGTTNVYQVSWTHEFTAHGGKTAHRVWESGEMLLRAASLAACDATPGSFYATAPTAGGPDLIYVHPTGSTAPTLEYQITKRLWSVQLYEHFNQAHVTGLETIGNAHADGSLVFDGYAEDCVARDGRIHNAFVLGTAVGCQAIGTEFGLLSALFVSYIDSSGAFGGPNNRNTIYRHCIADAQIYHVNYTGFLVHNNNDGRSFGTVEYDTCEARHVGGGWSATGAAKVVTYRCDWDDVQVVHTNLTLTNVMLGGQGSLHDSVNASYTTLAADGYAFTTHIHGAKVWKTAAGGNGPIAFQADLGTLIVERCTFANETAGVCSLLHGSFTFNRNVITGINPVCVQLGSDALQVAAYAADYNAYWVDFLVNGLFQKLFSGAAYLESVAAWQTYLSGQGLGPETHSIPADPQLADPAAGDFTIGNATVLALGAGAEPNELDDPALQALWELHRI